MTGMFIPISQYARNAADLTEIAGTVRAFSGRNLLSISILKTFTAPIMVALRIK